MGDEVLLRRRRGGAGRRVMVGLPDVRGGVPDEGGGEQELMGTPVSCDRDVTWENVVRAWGCDRGDRKVDQVIDRWIETGVLPNGERGTVEDLRAAIMGAREPAR